MFLRIIIAWSVYSEYLFSFWHEVKREGWQIWILSKNLIVPMNLNLSNKECKLLLTLLNKTFQFYNSQFYNLQFLWFQRFWCHPYNLLKWTFLAIKDEKHSNKLEVRTNMKLHPVNFSFYEGLAVPGFVITNTWAKPNLTYPNLTYPNLTYPYLCLSLPLFFQIRNSLHPFQVKT